MNNRMMLLIFILSGYIAGLHASGQRLTTNEEHPITDSDEIDVIDINTAETEPNQTFNPDDYITDSDDAISNGTVSPIPSEYDGSFRSMSSSDEESVVSASDVEDDGSGRFNYLSSGDDEEDIPGTPPPAVRAHRTHTGGASTSGTNTGEARTWYVPARIDDEGNIISNASVYEHTPGVLTTEGTTAVAVNYLNRALEDLVNNRGDHNRTREVIAALATSIEQSSPFPLDQQLVEFARQALHADEHEPQTIVGDSDDEAEYLLACSSSDESEDSDRVVNGRSVRDYWLDSNVGDEEFENYIHSIVNPMITEEESLEDELNNIDINDQELP